MALFLLKSSGINTGLSSADSSGGGNQTCSSALLLFSMYIVHFRNSREGKSTSGVGNPCAPHPLNKSLLHNVGMPKQVQG